MSNKGDIILRVSVSGAVGKMGSAVIKAVTEDSELKLVGAIDRQSIGRDIGEIVGIGPVDTIISEALESAEQADVLVDFTHAQASFEIILKALENDMHVVVGTTGLDDEKLKKIKTKSQQTGKNVFIAPNFAIGAVLMMELSKRVANYMDNVEIIEFHHDQKLDAPSGTALKTADDLSVKSIQISGEKENVAGSRGGLQNGIRIHSVRLPGLVAHQEVIFGTKGQTLTIRHDSIDRVSFMPGVIMAVKEVSKLQGLTIGLENLIKI